MHFSTAELLLIDDLSDGSFDQRRACEIQPAPRRHQDLVAQHRQIGAAGDAIAHDGGELRNAGRGDDRIISKDPPEVVLIWKNFAARSSRRAMRSRATSRPSLCWRSWPALPPPSRNCSSSARILSQRSCSVSGLAVRDDMRWTLNPARALLQAQVPGSPCHKL